MECIQKIYNIHRKEIYYLRFLLEAYEGAASMTTIDAQKGIVALHVAPGRETEVACLMEEFEHRLLLNGERKD